jgi:hypothetical protein
MPAGRNKKQTPRHDGSKSRVCRFCGCVGARVIDHGGFVHRRCVGPEPRKAQRDKTYEAMLARIKVNKKSGK